MTRVLHLLYGIACYGVCLATLVYAVGFGVGIGVPKTIDSGTPVALAEALSVDLALLTLFALQHSVMARRQFKAWWTRLVPQPVERSTFVLLSSLTLALLFWQWRPIPAIVWSVEDSRLALAVTALSMLGWVLVLTSTFLINHFELFGVRQVIDNLAGRPVQQARFRTPLLYKVVRHPIYLGFIIAFWATPVMTVGHLLFAAVTTAYIVVGIQLEERDLIELFGDEYRRYRDRVSMLVPWRRSA